MTDDDRHLRELVADVAAAYFSNAHVSTKDISEVISQIASSLAAIPGGSAAPQVEAAPSATLTAGQIRKSITPEALISFEDGKGYKTLRRHLAVKGMTPDDYRAKWGLPGDYPMVAQAYSAYRSRLAKSLGLGRKPAPARGRGTKARRG